MATPSQWPGWCWRGGGRPAATATPHRLHCPSCDRTYLVERVTKRHGHQLICESEACKHSELVEA